MKRKITFKDLDNIRYVAYTEPTGQTEIGISVVTVYRNDSIFWCAELSIVYTHQRQATVTNGIMSYSTVTDVEILQWCKTYNYKLFRTRDELIEEYFDLLIQS